MSGGEAAAYGLLVTMVALGLLYLGFWLGRR